MTEIRYPDAVDVRMSALVQTGYSSAIFRSGPNFQSTQNVHSGGTTTKRGYEQMSMQKLAIGSAVGAIVLFVLGYVIFDLLILDYYVQNAGAAAAGIRESQLYWAIIIGTLGYGALVTYLVDKRADVCTVV